MRVGVILYVNRSGSTLFSRLLAEASGAVFVFPELGVIRDLLLAVRSGRTIRGEALATALLADPRAEAIGLPAETLRSIAIRHTSANMPGLFQALASARRGSVPAAVVVKLESLAYLSDTIEAALPGATLFHVVRDPRAVVASMLRTPVPEKPGFDMARGSIVYAARHWSRYQHIVSGIAATHPVRQISYERLLASAREVCASALAALGVAEAVRAEGTYRAASIDSSLHPRVGDEPDLQRSTAWERTLSPRDVRVVEAICREGMQALGYVPRYPRSSLWSVGMADAMSRHVVAMVRHGTGTAALYMRRPDRLSALTARIRLALAARKAARHR